jgi:hypothetical protein
MLVINTTIQKTEVGLVGFFEISNQPDSDETEKNQGYT